MPPERRTLLVVGLVAILVAALLAWFLANFERRPVEVPMGASAEARRNPFLAAERFLRRLDIPVESQSGRDRLFALPPPTDTLVVKRVGPLNAERRAALLEWMGRGGHLVAEASAKDGVADASDELWGELGIRVRSSEGAGEDCPDKTVTEIQTGTSGPALRVAFGACRVLEVQGEGSGAAGSSGSTHLEQVSVGAGLATLLSDTGFITNEAIGDHDHALLLARLVRPSPGGKVWMLYEGGFPWLGTLLWRAVPGVLIGSALLAPVWLWGLGARLGPLDPPPDRRRRDLIEHLEASGDFLWREGQGARLVEGTRQRVMGIWQRRYPELRRLRSQERVAALARALGQPPEAMTLALTTQADDARGFVLQARRLQRLWHGARPTRASRRQSPTVRSAMRSETNG